jgi:HEPN domain-containing protein
MAERSADWLNQAKRDLQSARSQKKEQFYEWAAFIAQQSAEKACKAVLQKLGAEAWGHVVSKLLKAIEENTGESSSPETITNRKKAALFLDKFYIPARYPNGWGSGTPADYITEEDAEYAIDNSEKILRFCESFFSEPEASEKADQEDSS